MKKSSLAAVADTFRFIPLLRRFILHINELEKAEMKLGGPYICYIMDLNEAPLSVFATQIVEL